MFIRMFFIFVIAITSIVALTGCDTEPEFARIRREAKMTPVPAVASDDANVQTDPDSGKLIGCTVRTEIDGKTWYIQLNPSWAWHLYSSCIAIKKNDSLLISLREMETGQRELIWKGIVPLKEAL